MISKPSPDGQRMIYGILLLAVLATLASRIAFGQVEEKTSYGLMPIITSLATLAGAFAQWAFGTPREPPKPPQP
jgi:hypothetical protein